MQDAFQRTVNYLRLSVTDRCNLRCRYCMPADGVASCGHDQVLRYEQLLQIARVAAELGIEKIRVTGGEPLVRKGLVPFLEQLSGIAGIDEIALTTNGLLLREMADQLKAAGVRRVNISLDSLDVDRYREITRGGNLNQTLSGLERADQVGLQIKLNMVVMRGINDCEIEDFAALSIERPWAVRFIEYMPVIRETDWRSRVISGAEVLEQLQQRYEIEERDRENLCGPAKPYRIQGAQGSLGIITPLSEHFCGSCNRIRVTSQGLVKGCLLNDAAVDIRPVLETGDEAALKNALLGVINDKGANHNYLEELASKKPFSMSSVGG